MGGDKGAPGADGQSVADFRCKHAGMSKLLAEDWTIKLGIQDFFGSCPHELIDKAVEANTSQPWVVLYVRRWLAASLQHPGGTLTRVHVVQVPGQGG